MRSSSVDGVEEGRSAPPPTSADVSPALGRCAPTTLAARLHDVLGELLDADLTALSSDEHSQLVASLIRAQSRLHAATLDAVAAFDSADVASESRHRTTKRWIESRTRLSAAAASSMTRQARALRDHLRGTREDLAAGRITPQHASVIATVVRTVGPEHASSAESILLDLARHSDPATVGRATAAILATVHPDKAEKALQDAYERRGLRVRVVGSLGYLDGVLDVESTELVQSALMPLMRPTGLDDTRSAEQRRADALVDVVGHHLAHGDMPTQVGHRPHLSVVVDADQLPPDDESGSAAGSASVSASRGWAGVVSLPWTGTAVPASVARRWACDATVTPVVARLLRRPHRNGSAGDGGSSSMWLPLAVGRNQRTATAAQIKALHVRDGGCIHPGCSRTTSYCDAHHVKHWADGGETSTANMVLLCRHHHRTLHARDWWIDPDPGTPGLFHVRDRYGGSRPAQTALDRSPPARV